MFESTVLQWWRWVLQDFFWEGFVEDAERCVFESCCFWCPPGSVLRRVPPSRATAVTQSVACSSRGASGRGAESGCSASALQGKPRKCSEVSCYEFARCLSPSQRVAHVSDSVASLLSTQTRDMHAVMNSCGSVHGAVMHDNSSGVHVNSCGAVGHRSSCNSHSADLRVKRRL